MRIQHIQVVSLYLLLIVLLIQSSYAKDLQKYPQPVGPKVWFITLGRTPMNVLTKRLGQGYKGIGVHPGSAVTWRIQNGCFRADGYHYNDQLDIIVDRLMWSTGLCEGNKKALYSFKYKGLDFNSSTKSVISVLGSHYAKCDAYNKHCLVWTIYKGTSKETNIYASFNRNKLSLLSIVYMK